MIRETFPVGLLGCNCTILADEISHRALVVDPGADLPVILQRLVQHQLTVSNILITHAHIDHIASALELKRITGAPIIYSKADLPLVAMMDQQAAWLNVATPHVAPPDHSPADGEEITVGVVTSRVLHTPGHTTGSLCLHLPTENLLLAGDTLFAARLAELTYRAAITSSSSRRFTSGCCP